MKLRQDINLLEFLTKVQQCRQDIFFYSEEGDQLNLKSVLSQYMLTAVFSDKALIDGGEIVCTNADDYQNLAHYLK